jgi:hypothetical protein
MTYQGREMRDLINKWLASKVYAEYLEKRKKMTQNRLLTKVELEDIINSILAIWNMPKEQREELELIDHVHFSTISKLELFKQLAKTLSTWYMYLNRHLRNEEYELCAKLRDVIQIEQTAFYELIEKYCYEFEPQNDLISIEIIDSEVRKVFNI